MSCQVCRSPDGCERCRGGPGEQGLTHDEKQLLELRERERVALRQRDELAGLILAVEVSSRAGVSCPWCGGPKGEHTPDCRAFAASGAVRLHMGGLLE